MTEQLELLLWKTLQTAQMVPERVDFGGVLAMVDQMEAEAAKKEEVLAIAYNENVSAWIEAITRWLQTAATGQVQFDQLCQGLGMPQIEVWLEVLLGGFELGSKGEFYSGLLWVRRLASDGMDTTGAIAL